MILIHEEKRNLRINVSVPNVNAMKLYNKLIESQKLNNIDMFKALYDEIISKLSNDKSDRKVYEVCLLVLEQKIELANSYKKKKKNILFESELIFANTIIHAIFAPRYSIVIVNGLLTLLKKNEK